MTTSSTEKFNLPDVGEGLTEAEIVTWHVAVGDHVEVNQVLVDIETAKSVVELPSPFSGEVVELLAAEGDTVEVGTAIIAIGDPAPATDGGVEQPDTPAVDPADNVSAPAAEAPVKPVSEPAAPADNDTEPKLLVGYGARETTPRRRRAPSDASAADTAGAPAALTASDAARAQPANATSGAADDGSGPSREGGPAAVRAKASPPVRKLARALGVDLVALTPSGTDGIVTREDVLRAAPEVAEADSRSISSPGEAGSDADAEATAVPGRLGDQDGDVRVPVKGVRKHTAAAMVRSAFTAPHVTEFVAIDVTKTLALKEDVARRREFRDIKLSPLAFVAHAYLRALQRTPQANAQWDEETQEIVIRRDVNLGIAAATPRGLLVPNIRAAQRLDLCDLAAAINHLAATARAGETEPAAMIGGTATITNLGVFGVDSGTPILNPGETTILAVGTIKKMPWVVEVDGVDTVQPRPVLQLALSFDHRVLDGQQGSQLLADTSSVLDDPLGYAL